MPTAARTPPLYTGSPGTPLLGSYTLRLSRGTEYRDAASVRSSPMVVALQHDDGEVMANR